MQALAGWLAGSSTDEPEANASQNSTDEGTLAIVIESQKPAVEQLEILQDSEDVGEQNECYLVLLTDDKRVWLCAGHVDEDIMAEWVHFKAKRRKVAKVASALEDEKLSSVGTASKNIVWRQSLQHKKALTHDGRTSAAAYPASEKLNGHSVVASCAMMPGIIVMKTSLPEAKSDIEKAIDRAMDRLLPDETPEVQGQRGLADDIGQTHKNLERPRRHDAYSRLYLNKPAEESNKGKQRAFFV